MRTVYKQKIEIRMSDIRWIVTSVTVVDGELVECTMMNVNNHSDPEYCYVKTEEGWGYTYAGKELHHSYYYRDEFQKMYRIYMEAIVADMLLE